MPVSNYYDVLGVSRNASENAIQHGYRRLALKWHPHKHENSKESEVQFREIAEAYTILSDPIKRSKFDQYGEEGLKNGVLDNTEYRGYQYTGDPMKLFYDFFGEKSPFGLEQTQKFGLLPRVLVDGKAEETTVELRCTLEDIYTGAQKVQKVQRQRFDAMNSIYIEDKVLSVTIGKSWKAGMKLRFPGEGDQLHPRSKPGDLVMVITEEHHPLYERIDDTADCLYVHKVSLKDALCGHVLSVGLLDGKPLHLHIPEMASPGYEKRIIAHGFANDNGGHGDLVIRWDIEFPVLTSAAKEKLKALLP